MLQISFLELIFRIAFAHALADFVFQTDTMARYKSRINDAARIKDPATPLNMRKSSWEYWLSAHALVQGGMLWLLTGIAWWGMAETVVHWIIDYLKTQNRFALHTDQFLHLLTKVVLVIIALAIGELAFV
jgi:hypothetical protein